MNIDLLTVTKKLKRVYKRDSIKNAIINDNHAHFNNFLDCNNIDKNINQILDDETIAPTSLLITVEIMNKLPISSIKNFINIPFYILIGIIYFTGFLKIIFIFLK